MRHIPSLDGLRGVAVLLVLVTHLWTDPPGYTTLNRLASAGWIGVDLFFVLSGYLITGILWKTREDPRYFRNFYARRTLRIFPLYYGVLCVVLIGLPLLTTLPPQVMDERALYFLYLSNLALAVGGWHLFLLDITWSLAVEEQFYLAWPAVVRWANRRRLILLCLALIVLVPVARLLAWPFLNWRWLHMVTPFRLDAFAVGGLLALVPISPVRALALLVPLSTVLFALILTGRFDRDAWLVGTLGYSLTALTCGAALAFVSQTRWLTSRPLRHIGTVSYGMYLLHPLCLAALSGSLDRLTPLPLLNALLGLLLTTAAVTGVASLSYRLYESPFLRLKRHFVTPSNPRGSTRPTASADGCSSEKHRQHPRPIRRPVLERQAVEELTLPPVP